MALALVAGPGCGSEILRVKIGAPASIPAVRELRAGAAQRDLTPPPGAPLWGFAATNARPYARGYRTRLKAHAIVLEGPLGGRVALVQADLGAISRPLHLKVAERLARLGFGPDRLLLAATHTHAGPGGYFGDPFYNAFGAGRPGFDPDLLDWLVERVASAVEEATARLEPAAVGVATVRAEGVSFNRSLPAWEQNACRACGGEQRPQPETRRPDIDDQLRILRVDRIRTDGSGRQSHAPLAAFATFAVHATAVSKANELYHGDVLGYAWRRLAQRVRGEHREAKDFVAAFAVGAEGDVAPIKLEQSFGQAERAGNRLGDYAFAAYSVAGASLRSDVDFAHAYQEVIMPGGHTLQGDVCDQPMVGVPTLAGSEDGPSAIRGHFGVYEGRRRGKPEGCHGHKVRAFAVVQPLILKRYAVPDDPGAMPALAPFQVVALYEPGAEKRAPPLFVLATVPAEPTTAVGDDILRRVSTAFADSTRRLDPASIAIVGLGNAYLGYMTTPAEYAFQHYEGGSTFWGPLASTLVAERLESAALRARDEIARRRGAFDLRESSARLLHVAETTLRPGPKISFFGSSEGCVDHARAWSAPEVTVHRVEGRVERVIFDWAGLEAGHFCAPPALGVECENRPLLDPDGVPETDDGTRFHVERRDDSRWWAVWFPRPEHAGRARCRLRMDRAGLDPLRSEEFSL